MVAGKMDRGGLEAMLMGFFRNIDRQQVTFDFLLHYAEEGFYDSEIKALGGNIFYLPRLKPQNLFRYLVALIRFFRRHKGEYDIIHGHLTSVGILYLPIAKLFGVKTTIIHAHYADTKGNRYALLERLMLLPLRFCADYYFACSDKAAKFCFGNRITKKQNYKLIKNAVDTAKFAFQPELRRIKRKELGIAENAFAVLHVGRFEQEKNQAFLLDVLTELIKEESNAVLIIVGEGSLRKTVTERAAEMHLTDAVRFTGARNDVNEILSAADSFVLPSFFEGLPVSGIEAQTSGLPCIFSDRVTTEIDVTGNCSFVPLSDSALWANTLLQCKNKPRTDKSDTVRGAGYDIRQQAKELEAFYLECPRLGT